MIGIHFSMYWTAEQTIGEKPVRPIAGAVDLYWEAL